MPESNMERESLCESEPVELQPFVHQVGGHTSMFRFNEDTVCKPLCSREYQFYSTLPPELHPFTPQCKGSIEVQLVEDNDGYVTFVGYPSQSTQVCHPGSENTPEDKGSSLSPVHHTRRSPTPETMSLRLLRSGSIEVCCQRDKLLPDSTEKAVSLNPWSLKCHKRQLAKMRKAKSDLDTKFILLENLAARFSCPCVLDLKMGTRQHGDDAPESKKRSQMMKCEATTSASIGLRICGMQARHHTSEITLSMVYQASCGKFVFHNKYYGRSLRVDGFKEALHQFLHNGNRLRVDVVQLLLDRLQKLYAVVEKQETFRFYSSSLLIMYDGTDKTVVGVPSSHPTPPPSPSISSNSSPWTPNMDNTIPSDNSMPTTSTDHRYDNHNTEILSDHPLVDVRMIDFAHATRKDFLQDDADHNGPDHGYLFGLENLIKLLEEISQSCSSSS